jgi:signal transduction histidine kinase/DNA-binding response OmpR family regulator/CHASE3 domain sensor protein
VRWQARFVQRGASPDESLAVNRTASPAPRSRAWLPVPAFTALAAAVVAVVVIAALTYRSLAARAEAASAVNHTNAVQDRLHRFLSEIKDAETGQRGYLLTGAPSYLEPYDLALGNIPIEIVTLRHLVVDNPAQLDRLATLEPLVASKLAELKQTIDAKNAGDALAALAIVKADRGKVDMDRLRRGIEAMLAAEAGLLADRTDAWEATVTWSSYVMFGGVAALLLMLVLIGVLASRDFRAVEAEAWSRRVQLALTTELQGDLRLESIGDKVLRVLVENLHARVAALYTLEPGGELRRISGHALPASSATAVTRLGDGLTGQAATQDRTVVVRDLPAGYLDVSSAAGKAAPRELVIAPASADGVVQAVTELGFLHQLDQVELQVVDRMSESIALAIRTARDRSRLEELLAEVQRQTEELQTQQEELKVSNEELEQQSRALQVSQTQLENQQAELEQINAQLEEQAQSLEHQRDELARAGAELQRSNEVKSQFLANVSHELRTPLNSSLILSKLLADNGEGNLNPEQIRFAQTIYAAGNDLLTLINDILDLSKIEAGMLDVRSELITLPRLVEELGRTFQPIATQRHLALELRLADGAPETIETDATRLSQVLKNLLSNALKFTERGRVELAISGGDGQIRFAVRDTGIGIAKDQHDLIFEAFRQADGATNRKFGGTGLGLSISRDLSRLLGGDLQVESAPGQGSTFTLTLPVQRSAPVPRPAPRPAPPPPFTRPRPAPAPSRTLGPAPFPDDRDRARGAQRVLLIIEDDPAFARVLYELAHDLEFLGLVAVTADDGLALAVALAPSAIVLDVGLPDRSGLAVLDALKRNAETRHIPVHVVSGSDYIRAALEMGAAGYALKPVERARLVEAIKHLEAKFTQKLRRVLIVEDDALLRDSTARLLGGEDVQTVTAGTSAEALAQLRATTFDCMVLDLALPDGTGLELLEQMASGEQSGFPPVIVYTGRSLSHDQVHELERFSRSIIIKGARSPERLLDEVTLFLHQVESKLPPERQRMLRDVRDREAVFEGRRILVVEDDVRNVFALASVLEPKGAIVEIARNGREAVEHVRAKPGLDLVLMDIMMPEMDGLEATRLLRQDPRFARLPIIALTAKAMIDDREKCLAAGANDYIAKPLDVDKLLSLARVWIRK